MEPTLPTPDHRRRIAAEAIGTGLLLVAVVGSGIAVGEADGIAALFPHAVVVGAALVALILTFGPVSGAHLNPVVTAADAWFGGLPRGLAVRYVAAQVLGAVTGTIVTDVIFGLPSVALATTVRDGLPLVASETLATAGLLLVVFGVVRSRPAAVPFAVGGWITAAIVATSSTSLANPAVTVGRVLTDSWTGVAPASAPGLVAGQAVGLLVAVPLIAWLFQPTPQEAAEVVVPHPDRDASSPPTHQESRP